VRASTFAAGAVLAGAVLLVAPPLARGFETIGFQLEVAHRDLRIHNNFSDPEANQDRSLDPAFPGWYGADRAIWKAAAEWGSDLRRGTGEGDPGQPGDLGSGGANFDFFFSGRNEVNGAVGDDTHGELEGCAGGVHAFTEYFTDGSGFRTRYYRCWLWVDGPELDWQGDTGWLDLQGIATHELGHALGLKHTPVVDATMFATTTDGKSHRSLHADDTAGVQAIYGPRSPTKPFLTGAGLSGGVLNLTGSGFAPQGNELWFTSGAAQAGSDPVRLFDLPSSANGTRITTPLPPGSWSGEVLVATGAGGQRITTPWPLDLDRCEPPQSYCVSSPNSAGPGAFIAGEGSQSVVLNEFHLRVTGSVPNQFGLFFYGAGQLQSAVGNGVLCVSPPFFRLAPVQANAGGEVLFHLDLAATQGAGLIEAGSTWNFQWWYRDPPAGGAKYDFSDGLEVEFCP